MTATLFLDARRHGGHTYWTTTKGLAVADRSMRRWGNPASTDDGLLIVDEEKLTRSEDYYQAVKEEWAGLCRHCSHSVPLKGGSSTPASYHEFVALCHAVRDRRRAGAA